MEKVKTNLGLCFQNFSHLTLMNFLGTIKDCNGNNQENISLPLQKRKKNQNSWFRHNGWIRKRQIYGHLTPWAK